MNTVHVASAQCDHHEALVQSIQAVAVEWNVLDVKGHAIARQGGELLEKYEDIYLRRKYMAMVESGVFRVSKSTCQKWMRVWKHREQIKSKCAELGLDYETIGLTQALDLIRTPRNQGNDESRGEAGERGRTEVEEAEAEQEQVDGEEVQIADSTLPFPRPDPDKQAAEPKAKPELRAAPEGEDTLSRLADDALEKFRPMMPLQEIKDRIAKRQAELFLVVTVQAVATDTDRSILGQGTAEQPIQAAWLDAAKESQEEKDKYF